MLVLPSIGNIASNALIGTISSKLLDSFLISKATNKLEQQRWVRSTKLELFSQLSEDIFLIDQDNITSNISNIKRTVCKIILLLEDKSLIKKLDDYLFILNEYPHSNLDINLESINNEVIRILGQNIQQRI